MPEAEAEAERLDASADTVIANVRDGDVSSTVRVPPDAPDQVATVCPVASTIVTFAGEGEKLTATRTDPQNDRRAEVTVIVRLIGPDGGAGTSTWRAEVAGEEAGSGAWYGTGAAVDGEAAEGVVAPVRVVVVGGRVLDVEVGVVEVDLGDA